MIRPPVWMVASVFFLSGLSGIALSGCRRVPASQQVTIAQFGDLLLYLPLYIAKREGIFEKHGLEVGIVSTGGDDKTFAAVLSGSAQFGLADPTFVAIARERGQSGKVIVGLIDGVPNYGVSLTSATSRISNPRELKGKTIASVPAPSTSYALTRKLYESAGLKPAIFQVAPSGLVSALKTGNADYAILIEPWVSAIEEGGGMVAFSLGDYYHDFALTGLTVSENTVRGDSELMSKVAQSLTEAVGIFYDDPEAAYKTAIAQFPKESPTAIRKGVERMRKDRIYPRCLAVSEKAWQSAIQLRREAGDIQSAPLAMGEYVNNTFSEKYCSTR